MHEKDQLLFYIITTVVTKNEKNPSDIVRLRSSSVTVRTQKRGITITDAEVGVNKT